VKDLHQKKAIYSILIPVFQISRLGMKKLSLFLSIFLLLLLNGCTEPALAGKNVKKEYYTGGELRSEFIMDDKSGKNGLLKEYRYNGILASTGRIKNGVNDGMKILYDNHGRIIRKIPFVNGKIEGTVKDLYPNGDILATIPYKNGMRNGQAFSYNKDGSVYRSVTFKNDKIVN
jgi:antitoxin component YwqK of YwqJK toxin-antitoxin module